MKTKELSLEKRVSIVRSVIQDTIKKQSANMKIAEKKNDDPKWLQSYEMKTFCETIESILNGEYDLTE